MALNNIHCIRMLKSVLLATALLLPAGGCSISYKLNGASLDYSVYKTIHVSEFPIRAALVYPPLQQMFENELLDYITRNTRLRTVDGASDLQIEGEITGCHRGRIRIQDEAHYHGTPEIHRHQTGRQGHRPKFQRIPRL